MKSLTESYKIGAGPSSSHTMGPEKACKIFAENYKDADSFKVILYGSLAMTGKGHGTDRIVISTLKKPTEVVFNTEEKDIPHENTMDLIALSRGNVIDRWRVLSVGESTIPPKFTTLIRFRKSRHTAKNTESVFPITSKGSKDLKFSII